MGLNGQSRTLTMVRGALAEDDEIYLRACILRTAAASRPPLLLSGVRPPGRRRCPGADGDRAGAGGAARAREARAGPERGGGPDPALYRHDRERTRHRPRESMSAHSATCCASSCNPGSGQPKSDLGLTESRVVEQARPGVFRTTGTATGKTSGVSIWA